MVNCQPGGMVLVILSAEPFISSEIVGFACQGPGAGNPSLKELGQARVMQLGLKPPQGRGNSLGHPESCKPHLNPWGNL